MFKSVPVTVMAIALLSSANAASVYDKDGKLLYLDGRVQSFLSSGNHNNTKEIESAVLNSAGLSIGGKANLMTGYLQPHLHYGKFPMSLHIELSMQLIVTV